MTVRAGEITQFSAAGREFDVKGDSNVTYRLGGKKNETALNGNGTPHTKQTLVAAGVESVPVSIDPSRNDLEFLQDLVDDGVPVAVYMSFAGYTYYGKLTPQEVSANNSDGQAEVSFLGAKFEQI